MKKLFCLLRIQKLFKIVKPFRNDYFLSNFLSSGIKSLSYVFYLKMSWMVHRALGWCCMCWFAARYLSTVQPFNRSGTECFLEDLGYLTLWVKVSLFVFCYFGIRLFRNRFFLGLFYFTSGKLNYYMTFYNV